MDLIRRRLSLNIGILPRFLYQRIVRKRYSTPTILNFDRSQPVEVIRRVSAGWINDAESLANFLVLVFETMKEAPETTSERQSRLENASLCDALYLKTSKVVSGPLIRVVQNPVPVHTVKRLARLAGVSERTLARHWNNSGSACKLGLFLRAMMLLRYCQTVENGAHGTTTSIDRRTMKRSAVRILKTSLADPNISSESVLRWLLQQLES